MRSFRMRLRTACAPARSEHSLAGRPVACSGSDPPSGLPSAVARTSPRSRDRRIGLMRPPDSTGVAAARTAVTARRRQLRPTPGIHPCRPTVPRCPDAADGLRALEGHCTGSRVRTSVPYCRRNAIRPTFKSFSADGMSPTGAVRYLRGDSRPINPRHLLPGIGGCHECPLTGTLPTSSPQRRTAPASIPNRSNALPMLWSMMSATVPGRA